MFTNIDADTSWDYYGIGLCAVQILFLEFEIRYVSRTHAAEGGLSRLEAEAELRAFQ